MGYDIYNKNDEYFRWTIWGWRPVLRLALAHGWEPMGTISPDIPDEYVDEPDLLAEASEATDGLKDLLGIDTTIGFDWEGEYWSNAGQSVCSADAKNIASALRRAADIIELRREYLREHGLLDESDPLGLGESPKVRSRASESQQAGHAEQTLEEAYVAMLDENLSDGWIERIREFADYCEQGAFRIY